MAKIQKNEKDTRVSMRQVPESALSLIRKFEGCKLKAYRCPAGKWSIGYGSTKGVYEGQEITQDQAEIMLLQDAQEACDAVLKRVRVPLSDCELSALVSFVFNEGKGNFKKSELLKKLNEGHYDAVPFQLMRWRYCKGVELGGLVRRRRAEASLWNLRA